MAIQRVHSKWAKTKVLLKSELLQPHIPITKLFNYENVDDMLHQYEMIYIKPDKGMFGNGVTRVERTSAGYRFQRDRKIHNYSKFASLYQKLLKHKKNRKFIVQKGIYLLRHQKRRFDLRVMVQINARNEWETTGIIGRLSHPAKIVTNYHSGGTLYSIEKLMSQHMSDSEIKSFKKTLRRLGVSISTQLQTAYPGLKEIGVDVAVDDQHHPWILEVNTMPDPFIFRKLSDKSVFRKVYQYACAYGRYKGKRTALTKSSRP